MRPSGLTAKSDSSITWHLHTKCPCISFPVPNLSGVVQVPTQAWTTIRPPASAVRPKMREKIAFTIVRGNVRSRLRADLTQPGVIDVTTRPLDEEIRDARDRVKRRLITSNEIYNQSTQDEIQSTHT